MSSIVDSMAEDDCKQQLITRADIQFYVPGIFLLFKVYITERRIP